MPTVDYLPQLASVMMAGDERASVAFAHIGWWARRPDAGSKFERSTHTLTDMSDEELAAALRAMGYDGLLYLRQGAVIGHVFFQRHGAELHGFSLWAHQPLRGNVFFRVATMDFLAHAFQTHGVRRARAGSGRYPITNRVLAPLKRIADQLGWRLHKDGWVDFIADRVDNRLRDQRVPATRGP